MTPPTPSACPGARLRSAEGASALTLRAVTSNLAVACLRGAPERGEDEVDRPFSHVGLEYLAPYD